MSIEINISYPFDSGYILRKKRKIKRDLLESQGLIDKRIAILGGSTTNDIKDMLEIFLLSYGIRPSFYESEYAQYWQDAMFENEALETFVPDIIYIHTSFRNITELPNVSDESDIIRLKLNRQFDHFRIMWDKLNEKYHCPIIQNNFEYPYYRLLGNQDSAYKQGRVNFVTELNLKFYDYAREHEQFYINDINYQAADYGLKKWSDPFYWHMYKYCCCLEAIPILAYNVANIIKAIYGKNKKALALDLDNTLWGGIVGDDGVENLEIGQETSMGQVYSEFQSYLKELSKQGILLNIISKNEEENAKNGMGHPQMVLKESDFISIKANWEPKSQNLKQMANELTLLPESFVFVDDNPAEREIVRRQLSGVGIPLMDKPENYITAIDRAGYFEVVNLSKDDLKRTEMYKENMERAKLESSFENYEDYLLSLKMNADIKAFEPVYMARIAQLTNKSNQFNLTTLRCSQEEIERYAENSEKYITLYGKLEDCFGDNGVVSLTIGEINDDRLDIILWLMSCRVLKRDMEFAMMDELVSIAASKGITTIYGHYYPTAKNKMVKDFYDKQGFNLVEEDSEGNSLWKLDISTGYKNKNNVITIRR